MAAAPPPEDGAITTGTESARGFGHHILHPARWIASWELWSAPRAVVTVVFTVEFVALASTAATATLSPIGRSDLVRFALLAVCALLHIEVSRRIEHKRELGSGSGPYLDLKSVWNFAALLVLPPALASAMVVLTYGFAWLRIWRGRRPMVPHRWLYSCCTVLVANQAAVAVLALGPGPHPGTPTTVVALAVVAAAGALRWLVNYALVLVTLVLSSPGTPARKFVDNFGEQVVELGVMGLGLLVAGVVDQPVLLVGALLTLFAMQRTVLLSQFQKAAQTDHKTGLYNAEWWTRLTAQSLERTQARDGTFGVLMLDLDFFKNVNDTHGHIAGDQVLRAIASTLKSGVRDMDIVGRFGGEEFVVALPDVDVAGMLAVGNRLRANVEALTVDITSTKPEVGALAGTTVSIGAALAPTTGTSVDELLRAADAALQSAKAGGRNRIQLATGLPAPTAGTRATVDRTGRR